MQESKILNEIRVGVSPGSILFRQQVGTFLTREGYPIKVGFKGTPDLCGWTVITITPDLIGRRVAVFTGIEVKTETGRIRPEQQHFIDVLKKAGGIAGIARSLEEAKTLLHFP